MPSARRQSLQCIAAYFLTFASDGSWDRIKTVTFFSLETGSPRIINVKIQVKEIMIALWVSLETLEWSTSYSKGKYNYLGWISDSTEDA